MNPFPRFTYSGGLPTGSATVTLFNSATAGVRVSWPGANNKLAIDLAASQSGTLVASKSVDGGLTWVQMESVAVTGSSTASTQDEWVVEPLADIRVQWTNGGVDQTVFMADMAFVPRNAAIAASTVGISPGTVVLDPASAQINRAQVNNVIPIYRTSASAYARGAVNSTRLEDTGDGAGGLYLVERDRTVLTYGSLAVGTASWVAANGATVTPDTVAAPDGTASVADVIAWGTNVNGIVSQTISAAAVPDNSPLIFSAWVKTPSAGKFRFWLQDKAATTTKVSGDFTATSSWALYRWNTTAGAGSGNLVARMRASSDAAGGGAGTIHVGGLWVEIASYPCSGALNLTTAITQSLWADLYVYNSEQVPTIVRAGKWTRTIRPNWSSSDLVSGDIRTVISFGGSSNVLRFRHTGTDVRLEAVVGGSVVASSGAVSATQGTAFPIVVDSAAGVLTVNGVAGSAGSAIVWPAGVQAREGGVLGGANELDGAFSPITAAA